MEGVVDQILQFFPETFKIMLSFEILHFQGLVTLRVKAVHYQRLQNVTFRMQLLKQRLQDF